MLDKNCNYCHNTKNISEFSVNKATKDGYENKCKDCLSTLRKNKYQSKKPAKKEYIKPTHKLCKDPNCKNKGMLLSLESFGKSNITKDGYENKCLICRKNKRKENALNSLANSNITEKWCTAHKRLEPIANFNTDITRDDGYSAVCKEYKSKYYQTYMEDESHREAKRESSIKYHKEHPEKAKEYYQNNKEEIKEKILKYKQTDKGKFVSFISQANERKLEYSISQEEYLDLISNKCTYCGKEGYGIDRVDSNDNYNIDNSYSCCTKCNYFKKKRTANEFETHINKIVNFQTTAEKENAIPLIKYSGISKKDYELTPAGKYYWYKSRAKRRKIEYKLSYEEFVQFWQKSCHYCGGVINTVGLDRVDNSKGYEIDNIVPCCWNCNDMKSNLTTKEFISHAFDIYHYKNSVI